MSYFRNFFALFLYLPSSIFSLLFSVFRLFNPHMYMHVKRLCRWIWFSFVLYEFTFASLASIGMGSFFIASISFIQYNLLFSLACSKRHFSARLILIWYAGEFVRQSNQKFFFLRFFIFSLCFLYYYLVMLLLCNALPILFFEKKERQKSVDITGRSP